MNKEARRLLDERIAPLHRLEHPFYKAWANGDLTKEHLAIYAEQYWHHIEAFPTYLETLCARLPEGAARTAVEENLADEVDGHHDDLWLDFAKAVGVTTEALETSRPTTVTSTAINGFKTACGTASPAFALGALYAYESHTPATAVTKSEGLRDRYGVEKAGRAYFDVHAEVDHKHSEDLFAAIEDVTRDPDAFEEALAGAEAGARSTWLLLDGIAERCGIDC
jgi:pyrroloquinoline-quinone synthase